MWIFPGFSEDLWIVDKPDHHFLPFTDLKQRFDERSFNLNVVWTQAALKNCEPRKIKQEQEKSVKSSLKFPD